MTIYGRLSVSRIPRDSLKYFEISVPRHIRVEGVGKTINRTTAFNKWVCNLTPEVRDIFVNIHLYSRLSVSRILRDSLNYFEISVSRHIRVERVRKTVNRTTTFNKWICNLTPEVRHICQHTFIQSALGIWNSTGLSEILRDIRTSTYQIAELRKNYFD